MTIRIRMEESSARCLLPMLRRWIKKKKYTRLSVHIAHSWDHVDLVIQGELPLGWQEKLCAWTGQEGNEKSHKKSFY